MRLTKIPMDAEWHQTNPQNYRTTCGNFNLTEREDHPCRWLLTDGQGKFLLQFTNEWLESQTGLNINAIAGLKRSASFSPSDR